jgi:adenine-specific DNA-methyltransferase
MEQEAYAVPDTLQLLESRRLRISGSIDRSQRSALGQFFTPRPVARYMASLLEFIDGMEVRLLDPGAGIGSLTAAVAERAGDTAISATCYEVEPAFQSDLRNTLSGLPNVSARIEQRDFIQHAVLLATTGTGPRYTHAILNPPYKKIQTGSQHRGLLRKIGLETSNLYTCFLACCIALCKPGAQVVAIVPRSFMNGVYFKPFRYWLLEHAAITHIHVFASRDRAFGDDDVLQENVILRLRVGGSQGSVSVSSSCDQYFSDVSHRLCRFAEIVTPGDEERFIHVPTPGSPASEGLPGHSLRELGLDVCTGPVVDFRLRDHIRDMPERGTVPLLYASHFAGGSFQWPRAGRKSNAIHRNAETERWLMPNGSYVVLRRFSSKEERRRVVAHFLDGNQLPGRAIGFENHLNVIHRERQGLSPDLARGLVAYLNSREVDDYFRVFSGHTQVNAADLRRLRYPDLLRLRELGRS